MRFDKGRSLMRFRGYVRFLIEAAISGEAATQSGLALFRGPAGGGQVVYVLYDPGALAEEAKDQDNLLNMNFERDLDRIVLGFIKADPRSGDCNNAIEVKMSVASKGYGPLLYDIVMSDGEGGVMPDRVSTSGKAKNVWQFYSTNRKDIKKKMLDDYDNPKTPEPEDDCQVVDDKDDVLNYSYSGSGQPAVKTQLMKRHDDAAGQFEGHGLKRAVLEKLLARMGQALFDAKYGE